MSERPVLADLEDGKASARPESADTRLFHHDRSQANVWVGSLTAKGDWTIMPLTCRTWAGLMTVTELPYGLHVPKQHLTILSRVFVAVEQRVGDRTMGQYNKGGYLFYGGPALTDCALFPPTNSTGMVVVQVQNFNVTSYSPLQIIHRKQLEPPNRHVNVLMQHFSQQEPILAALAEALVYKYRAGLLRSRNLSGGKGVYPSVVSRIRCTLHT
ncbi:MAG: hypothetical protein EOO38_17470 [Cytophagaceae bacterium]|nr:MAG: hypothetical protein EOO38_17470 [Cytophagaceae bacterium]